VTAYLDEGIQVEEAGLQVGPAPELALVDELQHRLDQDPALKAAFETLTPGRQREYNQHISAAKQSKTREARVEKYTQDPRGQGSARPIAHSCPTPGNCARTTH